jgi:hypothetical protein
MALRDGALLAARAGPWKNQSPAGSPTGRGLAPQGRITMLGRAKQTVSGSSPIRAIADGKMGAVGLSLEAMIDYDPDQDDAPAGWATPEVSEAAAPRRDDCQRHIVQRVIAALRRSGINCSIVLTHEDEPH